MRLVALIILAPVSSKTDVTTSACNAIYILFSIDFSFFIDSYLILERATGFDLPPSLKNVRILKRGGGFIKGGGRGGFF